MNADEIKFLAIISVFAITTGLIVGHFVHKHCHKPWADDLRRRRIELEARNQRLIDRQRRKP